MTIKYFNKILRKVSHVTFFTEKAYERSIVIKQIVHSLLFTIAMESSNVGFL